LLCPTNLFKSIPISILSRL